MFTLIRLVGSAEGLFTVSSVAQVSSSLPSDAALSIVVRDFDCSSSAIDRTILRRTLLLLLLLSLEEVVSPESNDTVRRCESFLFMWLVA